MSPEFVLGDNRFSLGAQIGEQVWSPDGAVVAAAHVGRAVAFDAATGNVLHEHHLDGLEHLVAAPDRHRLLVGNHRGLWELSDRCEARQRFAFEPYQPGGWRVEMVLGTRDGRLAVLGEATGFGGGPPQVRIRIVTLTDDTTRATIHVDERLLGTRSLWARFKRQPTLRLDAFALSPDGLQLIGVATASRPRGVKHAVLLIWECLTGALQQVTPLPDDLLQGNSSGGYFGGLVVSSDGMLIAYRSHVVQLGPTPTYRGRILGGPAVFIGPDRLAVAGDTAAEVVDAAGATLARYPYPQPWFCLGISASPDGRLVAIADETRLRLLAAGTLTPVMEVSGHTRPVQHLVTDSRGDVLFSAEDSALIAWDLAGRTVTARSAAGASWGMAVAPDGSQLIVGRHRVEILDARSLATTSTAEHMATAVAWPDAIGPLTIHDDRDDTDERGDLVICEGLPLRTARAIQIPAPRCLPLIGHDGRVAILGHDDITYAVDLQTPRLLWNLRLGNRAWAISGRTLILDASDDRGLLLLDVDVGTELGVLPLTAVDYHAIVMATAADSPRFALTPGDHRVIIGELRRTGMTVSIEHQRELVTAHLPQVTALALSGDGRRLFVGGGDGVISVYRL